MREVAELIFPNIEKDPSYYEEKYPIRHIKEGARVSRYAPSPTGNIHMGALFAAFVEGKVAHDTDGIFYLRIEDTDGKREIENGIENIINDLNDFGIHFDEGVLGKEKEKGEYGPYIQSKRKEIYQTYIKSLLEQGKAYVSFETADELENIRSVQEKTKQRIGYYGPFAKDRNLSSEEVIKKIKEGIPYVIRLKSTGNFNKRFVYEDLVKGKIEMPENDLDIVIMKGDGLPTYHFAHVIDDHLMRTTHVIRGEEWISSIPVHMELWRTLGFKAPKYAHIPPLMKEDNGIKRKLSKRKDLEAAVHFYEKEGIPPKAVLTYLMTIANSNFEEFLLQNKDKGYEDFTFDFKKMSKSGALFDLEKLKNISRNYLSLQKASLIYKELLLYTQKYDQEFFNLITKYKEETIAILNIEREQKKPRKDFYAYGDIKNQIWYMYDELFNPNTYDWANINDPIEIQKILHTYLKYYNESDDEIKWFNKLKDVSETLGYAREVREYKESPHLYKGHVGDISMVLRVALTSLRQTPNLYDIINTLGKDRMKIRINTALQVLKKDFN